MALRPASLSDVDVLLPLVSAFCAEDGHPYEEAAVRRALEGLLRDPAAGRAFLVHEENRGPVGYLVVTFGYSLEFRGRDAFVDELYVAPNHRGRGHGREALRTAEACCREAGAHALHLEVRHDNLKAQRLYRSWGFGDRGSHLMSKSLGSTEAPEPPC
jgi:ribosomal protein S18 acetylase RimI-like enzyme